MTPPAVLSNTQLRAHLSMAARHLAALPQEDTAVTRAAWRTWDALDRERARRGLHTPLVISEAAPPQPRQAL